MATKEESWTSWVCPFCLKKVDAPLGFIENAVKTHIQLKHKHKVDNKVQEHILRSLKRSLQKEFFERIIRKHATNFN